MSCVCELLFLYCYVYWGLLHGKCIVLWDVATRPDLYWSDVLFLYTLCVLHLIHAYVYIVGISYL